jgi:hypothetical protein
MKKRFDVFRLIYTVCIWLTVIIAILTLQSCDLDLIDEYLNQDYQVEFLNDFEDADLNFLGIQLTQDTTFHISASEIKIKSIQGSARNATIKMISPKGERFRIDVKGSINLSFYRLD